MSTFFINHIYKYYKIKISAENINDLNLFNKLPYDIIEIIGSGSIGQVYRAKMIDGREIAFKVKHPEIETQKRGQFALINLIVFLQRFKFIKNRMNLHFDIANDIPWAPYQFLF